MYLGWFDDNPKKTSALKIQEAIFAYTERFKTQPNVVLVKERREGGSPIGPFKGKMYSLAPADILRVDLSVAPPQNLTDNRLTEAGIALLKASGIAELKTTGQGPNAEGREYLYNGCCE